MRAPSQGGSGRTRAQLYGRFLMIRLLSVLVLGVAVCAFTAPAARTVAADKAEKDGAKEVKLEGLICCGKCELKEVEKCHVTIVAEKGGKKTTYWFDDKSSKKYHGDICQTPTKGSVTGTVKKDGDKNIITVTDLKYAK
jgi:hypothetical protein